MANIQAIALKRFGTFALAFWGEMDKETFSRDSSTMIINLSSDTTQGKQDVKVLDFPEPQTMDGFLKTVEEKFRCLVQLRLLRQKILPLQIVVVTELRLRCLMTMRLQRKARLIGVNS